MPTPDPALLSLNTATTRTRWGLAQAIEGCARHGIQGISPWRDLLHAMGVAAAARAIRANGLTVTGLCRGGMFTAADAAGRAAPLGNKLSGVDEKPAPRAPWLLVISSGLAGGAEGNARAPGPGAGAVSTIPPFAPQ